MYGTVAAAPTFTASVLGSRVLAAIGDDVGDAEAIWQIVAGRDSTLCRMAAGFDPGRRYLFAVTYLAMRRLDDFIDGQGWQDDRHAALQVIAAFERFLEGGGVPSALLTPAEGDLLARLLAIAPFGVHPLRALCAAMRMDVAGRGLESWDDFADYGEGATVAPTEKGKVMELPKP